MVLWLFLRKTEKLYPKKTKNIGNDSQECENCKAPTPQQNRMNQNVNDPLPLSRRIQFAHKRISINKIIPPPTSPNSQRISNSKLCTYTPLGVKLRSDPRPYPKPVGSSTIFSQTLE